MADKKISQLTAAATPLAGTEVLPIVQSSATKKVATDDLTVKNVRSNATTGILQVAGPAAAATRTMTVPDANFTVARTDAGNAFTGDQTATGTVSATSLIPTGAPSSKWGLDGTNAALLITLDNDATYDLAPGGGVIYAWDNGGNGVAVAYCFYGTVAIVYNPSSFYTTTQGSAGKVNIYFNGVNNYRFENKTGSAKSIYIVTIRNRAAT